MANKEHFALLKKGVDAWNQWRGEHPKTRPDLYAADLKRINLRGANLNRSNFSGTDLTGADLSLTKIMMADFTESNLTEANLSDAKLSRSSFLNANLSGANLSGANLYESDFKNTALVGADLFRAALIRNSFEGANLDGCKIYGISSWDVNLNNATQSNLLISRANSPIIAVDNLAVAQFIYLLLHNKEIRDAIDTIASKVVLILCSFKPQRKTVLDAIRHEVRQHGYIPVLFDFERPSCRDTLETVSTLAHMARFVIADLTDARSVLQELQRIVPSLPSVPVKPLLNNSGYRTGMLDHFRQYRTFLSLHLYENAEELISSLEEKVLLPAQRAYENIHEIRSDEADNNKINTDRKI
jgi:hypothetical protein